MAAAMKINLIAPFALISLCVAACEQKSAQVTSTSSPPSSRPSESAGVSDFSGINTSSVAKASVPEQAAPAPFSSAAAPDTRPVFKSEAATQAASQYFDSYGVLLNDQRKRTYWESGCRKELHTKDCTRNGGACEPSEAGGRTVKPGRMKATAPEPREPGASRARRMKTPQTEF
jgi:hypothetical protein